AGVDRGALGLLVGVLLRWTLIEESLSMQPPENAITHAPNDALEHFARRRCDGVEADPPRLVGREHAVRHDSVVMHVQIQAAAEPLEVIDRCRLAAGDSGGALVFEGDNLHEDAS